MKLQNKLVLTEVTPNWFVRASFSYDSALVAKIKQWPGRQYESATKSWLVPSEMVEELTMFARELGLEVA